MKKEMTNINESKVLLDIEFEDSLQEGNFNIYNVKRKYTHLRLNFKKTS